MAGGAATLHAIDEQALCPELVVDRGGRIASCNGALGRLLGRDAAELAGQFFEDVLTAASGAIYQNHVLPMLALRGQIGEFALTLRRHDGTPTDVLLYASADRQDVTQPFRIALAPFRSRRNIEDELLRIKRAADEAPSLLFQASVDGAGTIRIDYVSEAVSRMFGCTAQQARVSARCMLDVIDHEDLANFLRPPPRLGEEHHHFTIRLHRAQGALGVCEVRAVLRGGPGGRAVWLGHINDVTEHLALAEEAAALRAAEQARQTQLQFLGRVSHELRTPLNAIIGFSQLLSDKTVKRDAVESSRYLNLIQSAGGRLLGLVDELLDVARLHDRSFDVQLEPVNVVEVVRTCLAMQAEGARTLGLALSVQGETELWVRADSRRISQLLDNLVSNAIKYNRAGGSVRVELQRGPCHGNVTVSDTGVGIAPERIATLFQPFNRLGAEALGIPGTGLGLVIAREIAERLGAVLQVESEPGSGSTFSFALPLAEPDAPVVRPRASHEPAARKLGDRGAAPSLKALYVDDDPVNCLLMAAIANSAGHVTLELADCAEAGLKAALAQPPDLLLVDRHLPDADGTQLLARMRTHAVLATTPAIMVSADVQSESQAAALEAGFIEYWTKPLDARITRDRLRTFAESASSVQDGRTT